MPTATRARFCLSGAILLAVVFAACDTAPGPSLYDPIEEGTYQPPKPDPQLTGIAPAPGDALAGVTELTLTGQNFVPSADSTFVYFDGKRYPVLSITPTEIRMRAPNLPQSGLDVKVSVLRAENFSQTLPYELLPAVERLGDQAPAVTLFGLTSDDAGNAYVSYLSDRSGYIREASPDGTYSDYATASASTYPGLAYSEVDGLLATRNVRAVYRITEGGSASGSVFFAFPNTAPTNALRLRAVDVDAAGNIWTAGSGVSNIYRIAPDKTTSEAASPGSVLAIETRADYVYASVLSSETTPVNRIYRFALNGNGIGAAEEVVNISAAYPNVQVTALAFAANGDLFMGTTLVISSTQDNETPILELPEGGSLGELYDGLLVGDVSGLAWGNGTILYAAGAKIVTDSKSSSTRGDLVQINTLRTGER